MLDEFARALDFPQYFGRNWDALEDCLTDLEWLSAEAFVLIITNADQLLKKSPGELKTLAGILSAVASHWASSDPPASFHCLFHCEPGSAAAGSNVAAEFVLAISLPAWPSNTSG